MNVKIWHLTIYIYINKTKYSVKILKEILVVIQD